ncbi:hypothetical protein [Streptomyces californicus]|uniref:hypothetical protein n=1 Tax=Streptomyces californicus TaxID=67351 RepID=UPI00296ED956|nr:hypothetical protein [Streptomyces californicus]MDW4912628.1 hypothetical protein [Streptomyces californicus]
MKLPIDHVCGHRATADIGGTDVRGERARTAAWLAEQPCPECRRDARERGRAEEAEAAAATARERGWPSLSGSVKQVAWAETIRAAAITAMGERITARVGEERGRAAVESWTAVALRQTEAAWWIDNRDVAVRAVNSTLTTAELDELKGLVG